MNTSLSILSHDIRVIDNLYCLNDLHKAAGNEAKHKPDNFLRQDNIKDLIAEIDNFSDVRSLKITKGRNGGTYVCKELVFSYAMWISAKFHLHVIRAYDAMQSRNHQATVIQTLTPAQKCHIKAIIADKCKSDSTAYQTLYTKLNNNFGVARYDEILAANYPAACQFLGAKPLEGEIVNDALPVVAEKSIDVQAAMVDCLAPVTRKLPDHITDEITKKAISMGMEAFDLSLEHLKRKAAGMVNSYGEFNRERMESAIHGTTLGKALTIKHEQQLQSLKWHAQGLLNATNDYCSQILGA